LTGILLGEKNRLHKLLTDVGNPHVRLILCEAANATSKTRCRLPNKFKGLMISRGRKRAIFAIVHKLLKILFLLLDRSDY